MDNDYINNFIKRYTHTFNLLNDPRNSQGVKAVISGLIKRYFKGTKSAFAHWYHISNHGHSRRITDDRIMTANEARTIYDWDYNQKKARLDKLPRDRVHDIFKYGQAKRDDVPSADLYKLRQSLTKALHHDRETLASLKRNFNGNDWCVTKAGFVNHLSPLDATIIKLDLEHPGSKNVLGPYVIHNMNKINDNYKHHRPLVWL